MVEMPDSLLCLFSTSLEQRDGSYQIEIPKEEIERETVTPGEVYRIALLSHPTNAAATDQQDSVDRPIPPVEKGDIRTVQIDTLGDQGDGIARVERGYVLIVPDAEPDQEVTVEIETVRENVAFAQIVTDKSEPL